MMGGVLAMRMGLPVKRLVIATNENDEFPRYLDTGTYRPIEPSRNCLSSAMNVGHPSNLARLITLYGGAMDEKGGISRPADLERMRAEMFAVSWAGLQKYLSRGETAPGQLCVSLETAHPAKFPEEIRALLGFDPPLPPSLEGIESRDETFARLAADYPEFKEYLKKHYS
jgi:threonine synthase